MAAFAPTVPLRASAFLPSQQHSHAATTSLTAPAPCAARRRTAMPISMASETNIALKAAKVDVVKERLDGSMLIFNASLDGLTVANMSTLKRSMPEGTVVGTVKNTLMRRAVADSTWAPAEQLTNQSSFWVFVGSDMKASVKAYNDFVKELKRDAPIRGGVFDGEYYNGDGIDAVSKMPSKQELMQQVAVAVKMVPTKLGRSVKAVPTKVARAIKLAVADEDSDAPAEE